MRRPQLIVFAKVPRPGFVKTRLTPPLSAEQAALVYEAMLGDVLELTDAFARDRGLERVLAFTPAEAVGAMLPRTPPGYRLQAQRGLGLAERMANAFAECDAAGAPWALLRGSDSPGLGGEHLEEAIDRLEAGAELVLTPDSSGGYAMIGLREAQRMLFELPMSNDELLARTMDLAREQGLDVGVTRPTFDLDRVTDFVQLESLPAEEASDRCPRTVQTISELRESGVL